jgi:hypothetical protein
MERRRFVRAALMFNGPAVRSVADQPYGRVSMNLGRAEPAEDSAGDYDVEWQVADAAIDVVCAHDDSAGLW